MGKRPSPKPKNDPYDHYAKVVVRDMRSAAQYYKAISAPRVAETVPPQKVAALLADVRTVEKWLHRLAECLQQKE